VTLLVIGVGGALGAISRYLASGWVQDMTGGPFPWGTMAVNVSGSLVLGFVLVWLQANVSVELRQFIALGFLGSFTTFSTFSYEAVTLARDGELWKAGGYVAGSVLLGVLGLVAGMSAATALVARN
jgi:fluoride exporter